MPNLSTFRGPRERGRFIATYDTFMRSWPVAFEERNVETAFGHTHVVASGDPASPPLVLLHAANATSAMWSPIIAAMSRQYRCYCIDTINDVNKSVATSPIDSVGDAVDWLQQIFESLGIVSARVAGLSYGGWLAALLALHAPTRVRHLTLLSPAATLAPLSLRLILKTTTPMLLRSSSGIRRSIQWMSTTPDAPSDPSVDVMATSMLCGRPLRPMKSPSVFTDDELRRITMPATVLIGDQEIIYRGGPEAALARAHRFMPNARTQLVPGANHLLALDHPGRLITEMSGAKPDAGSERA